jgi:L-asparaginase / beta-aspartyl-peptidase
LKPGMAVHGGAWAIPDDLLEAHRDGCAEALARGLAILEAGGSSLDAVEAAVVVMEDDETFDAGFGSFLNVEGEVTLDAAVMDGETLSTGAVVDLRGVPNAVQLARHVLASQHAVLVGEGAHRFALENDVIVCDPEALVSPRERQRWEAMKGLDTTAWAAELFGDTVGAVAIDREGNLAAATSTGGSPMKPLGRVGDSPFVGAGLYACNGTAAVSTTGHGELIIPLVWSKTAADLAGSGLPAQQAAEDALRRLERIGGRGGMIVIDAEGRIGVIWNTPHMAFAYRDPVTGEVIAGPHA